MTITVSVSDPALLRAVDVKAAEQSKDADVFLQDFLTGSCAGWRTDLAIDRVPSAAFILRFTPAEYSGIRTAGETDPKIAAVIARAESEPFVWLGSKEVTDAMTYLVGAGLLTAQRAGEIVAY